MKTCLVGGCINDSFIEGKRRRGGAIAIWKRLLIAFSLPFPSRLSSRLSPAPLLLLLLLFLSSPLPSFFLKRSRVDREIPLNYLDDRSETNFEKNVGIIKVKRARAQHFYVSNNAFPRWKEYSNETTLERKDPEGRDEIAKLNMLFNIRFNFSFFSFFFSDEKPITRSILLPRLLFLPPRFHEEREEREEGGSLMYLFLDKVLSSSYLERSWTQLHATQHRYVHTLTSRKSCGFLLCWLSSNWSSFVTLRNCLEDASRFSHGNCESTCRVNASQCASRIQRLGSAINA